MTEEFEVGQTDESIISFDTTAEMRQQLMEIGLNTTLRHFVNNPPKELVTPVHRVIIFQSLNGGMVVLDISTPELKQKAYQAIFDYMEAGGWNDTNNPLYRNAKEGDVQALSNFVWSWQGEEGLDWEAVDVMPSEQFVMKMYQRHPDEDELD